MKNPNNLAKLLFAVFLAVGLLGFGGCAVVPVHKQGRVAQADMQFSSLGSLHFDDELVAALEPGISGSGSANATGCSSCR